MLGTIEGDLGVRTRLNRLLTGFDTCKLGLDGPNKLETALSCLLFTLEQDRSHLNGS